MDSKVFAYHDNDNLVLVARDVSPEQEKRMIASLNAIRVDDSCALPPEPAQGYAGEQTPPYAVETIRRAIEHEGDAAYFRYLTAYKTGEIKEGRDEVKKLLQAARIIRLARATPDRYVAMEKEARNLFIRCYVSETDKQEFKAGLPRQQQTQRALVAFLAAKYEKRAAELGLL